jgi:hypothetical protein
VERIIPNPSPSDINGLKQEAIDAAIISGASPETVVVHIEIDNHTSKVTAIAIGSTEAKTTDLLKECGEEEALKLAIHDFGSKVTEVKLLEKTEMFFVFTGKMSNNRTPMRIIDNKGFIRAQCSNAKIAKVKAGEYKETVEIMWDNLAIFKGDGVLRPEFFICIGPRICDYFAIHLEQNLMLMDLDIMARSPAEEILVIGNVSQQK